MNRLYYSAYEELVALIRDRQHDIKNHINTIYSIIYTTNSYEELVERQKQYCNFVLESSKETQILLAAGNPLISGFLYQKNQEIKSRGMQVDYKLEKISFPLAATEYEIIEMLGILVDNAIEELAEADHESKKIVIGYTWDEQWDIFYVANTSRNYSTAEIARFFERNYSSKGNGRGIGLDKMRRKLQQLDGGIKAEMEPYGEAQYLKFSIMLPKQ
ncbi:MAG: GHKL domain-containing protein [Lachnospiraceae bacterium]|nr:GHKL domain-containing protein [Lachnospiraceae bacterium]